MRVDPEVLKSMSKELEGELGRLEKEIHALAGGAFNINSPRQLAEILFHKLGLPAARRTKITKGYSTSLDILEELAAVHPLARHVLDYRQMAKLKSTYADALPQLIDPATGRIHTSYNQTVASTGRLSSSDPNLQNIPARGPWGARFRRAFIPDKGHLLLAADYSQIELRVLAHLSQDPKLIATFLEDRDVHEETARLVFGDSAGEETRRRAKIINFSIVYGTSAFSLAKELGTSAAEAQKFIDRYFGELPGVKAYLDRVVEEARERGYSETILGRQTAGPRAAHARPDPPAGRPADRPQQPHPGLGGRPHQGGHAPRRPGARRPEAPDADDPPGPRRARFRGPRKGKSGGRAPGPGGHGGRGRAPASRSRSASASARTGPTRNSCGGTSG